MMTKTLLSSLGGMALLLGAAAVQAVPQIDTTAAWNGSSSITPFGETFTATYGQTFTVTGPETILNDFTFLIDDFENPDTVDFQAFVYAWDQPTFRATGPALFSGGALSTTLDADNGVFEAFTINTGGLNLVAGNKYVAFFSTSNLFDALLGTSGMAASQLVDPYAGGEFVFSNNGGNFAGLFASSWDTCNVGPIVCFVGVNGSMDLAFEMNFSANPVPEPGTLALIGLGLLGAGLQHRARKRA